MRSRGKLTIFLWVNIHWTLSRNIREARAVLMDKFDGICRKAPAKTPILGKWGICITKRYSICSRLPV